MRNSGSVGIMEAMAHYCIQGQKAETQGYVGVREDQWEVHDGHAGGEKLSDRIDE